MSQTTKTMLGAVVAAALAIAVYYGLIGQQQATSIQNQANQTLGTGPAGQPTSTSPNTTTAAPAPGNTATPTGTGLSQGGTTAPQH